LPDSKWIKDLFPSAEKVDSFRGSLMDLSSKFRDSLEGLDIGIFLQVVFLFIHTKFLLNLPYLLLLI
jgi:hypothetical protein